MGVGSCDRSWAPSGASSTPCRTYLSCSTSNQIHFRFLCFRVEGNWKSERETAEQTTTSKCWNSGSEVRIFRICKNERTWSQEGSLYRQSAGVVHGGGRGRTEILQRTPQVHVGRERVKPPPASLLVCLRCPLFALLPRLATASQPSCEAVWVCLGLWGVRTSGY